MRYLSPTIRSESSTSTGGEGISLALAVEILFQHDKIK